MVENSKLLLLLISEAGWYVAIESCYNYVYPQLEKVCCPVTGPVVDTEFKSTLPCQSPKCLALIMYHVSGDWELTRLGDREVGEGKTVDTVADSNENLTCKLPSVRTERSSVAAPPQRKPE